MKIRTPIAALLLMMSSVPPSFADTPLIVEAVEVHPVLAKREFQLIGEVVAKDTLTASFSSGGRVLSVEVQEGDSVRAGAVLARMDPVQQEQALRSAQAGLTTAKADYDQAVEDLSRLEKLLVSGATTRIARDNAADSVQLAKGALTQAEANLDRSQKAVNDTVLVAPQDATVTNRLVEPGQVVSAAQPALKLALGDAIDVVFNVPEVLIIEKPGNIDLQFSALNDPNITFTGVPREVSPLIDPATGTVEVTVGVTERPAGLDYGDAVLGKAIKTDSASTVLPYSAMSATVDGPAVWMIDPQKMTVSLEQINVDRFETGIIILKDPLPEGSMVVTRGAQLLYPGRVVEIHKGADQ